MAKRNSMKLLAAIGNALFVAITSLSSNANAASAPVVGYSFEYTQGTGQHDLTLTPDAISSAVIQGLRAGGINASPAPDTADAVVHVEVVASYEPQFQSLRIVSGTITLRGPRPGAANFERPILLCQTSIQAWRTSQNSQDAAYKVRSGLMQQSVQFAKSCRNELNHL
jgi:hypothetical protein